MRTCSKCDESKPEASFTLKWNGLKKGMCVDCRRAYNRDWYARNKVKHNEDNRRNNARYRRRGARIIRLAKSRPCMDCEQTFPPEAMDFDHRDPSTKLFDVGRMSNLSRDKIMAEIAKCDVVCSNCHRVREHRRRKRS